MVLTILRVSSHNPPSSSVTVASSTSWWVWPTDDYFHFQCYIQNTRIPRHIGEEELQLPSNFSETLEILRERER